MSSRVIQVEEIQSGTGQILARGRSRYAIDPAITYESLAGNEQITKDMFASMAPDSPYRGAWSAQEYFEGDVVDHENALWRANDDTLETEEPGVSDKWIQIVGGSNSAFINVPSNTALTTDAQGNVFYYLNLADALYSFFGDLGQDNDKIGDVLVYRLSSNQYRRRFIEFDFIPGGAMRVFLDEFNETFNTTVQYNIILKK